MKLSSLASLALLLSACAPPDYNVLDELQDADVEAPEDQVLSDDEYEERFTEAAHARANEREAAIRAEVEAGAGVPWAGSYYRGDGLGVRLSLTLAPRSGFLFEWNGCLGLYDQNFGDVTVDGDQLVLTCEFPNETDGFRGVETELVPVSWGERRYLVRAWDVMSFINDVNDGSEPRSSIQGGHFLRWGDHEKPVVGLPALPTEWLHALGTDRITAKILSVEEIAEAVLYDGFSLPVKAVIDAGREQGVLVGMRFRVSAPRVWVSGRVISVTEDRSTVVFLGALEGSARPEAGDSVSTHR